MHKTMPIVLAAILIAALSGCQSYGGSAEAQGNTVALQTVEAGCAKCSYHIAGVSSCVLGAKIDGKAYLVKGTDINTHAAGLCDGEKPATVSGEIQGNRFIASHFELKE